MHEWVLFLHVAAVLAFLTAHGLQVGAMLRMRQEADPQRTLALLDAMPNLVLIRATLGLVVITGLISGFLEEWWQQWWMWLSLALLAVIWAAMYRWGGGYFGLIQAAATRAVEERAGGSSSNAAMAAFEKTRTGWRPLGMMIVGVAGLGVILWLMMFKPF